MDTQPLSICPISNSILHGRTTEICRRRTWGCHVVRMWQHICEVCLLVSLVQLWGCSRLVILVQHIKRALQSMVMWWGRQRALCHAAGGSLSFGRLGCQTATLQTTSAHSLDSHGAIASIIHCAHRGFRRSQGMVGYREHSEHTGAYEIAGYRGLRGQLWACLLVLMWIMGCVQYGVKRQRTYSGMWSGRELPALLRHCSIHVSEQGCHSWQLDVHMAMGHGFTIHQQLASAGTATNRTPLMQSITQHDQQRLNQHHCHY